MKLICDPRCENKKPKHGQNRWTLVSGLLYLLMPKCAFCWAAYMSVLGSIGLSVQYRSWFLPLALLLFLLTLVKLSVGAVRSGTYAHLFLALVAAALMIWQQDQPGFSRVKAVAVVFLSLAVVGEKLSLPGIHFRRGRTSFRKSRKFIND